MRKRKLKVKWKNLIAVIIFLICFIFLILSIKDVLRWKLESNKIEQQIEKIQEIVEVEEVEDTEEVEIIEQVEEIPESNPYWDYINMNLINVDFDELKKINSNTKGWIQVNGTNINYPLVQAKDNKYYLIHSFDKSYNNAGWVFLDYRNNINSLSCFLLNALVYRNCTTITNTEEIEVIKPRPKSDLNAPIIRTTINISRPLSPRFIPL